MDTRPQSPTVENENYSSIYAPDLSNEEKNYKLDLINDETDKELLNWLKKKYEAYEITWKDMKYQVWSASLSYLFYIVGGMIFTISDPHNVVFDRNNITWLTSVVGSVLTGTLVSGILMDRFGRKKTNLMGAVPCSMAWFIVFILGDQNQFMLHVSRCLVGLAIGLETSSIVYVSEITHKKYRSFFLSLPTFNFVFGVTLIIILQNISPRILVEVICAISIFSGVILVAYFIPESPAWLMCYRSDLAEAKQSLKWLNPSFEVFEDEWRELTRTMQIEKEWTKKYDYIFFCRNVYKPFVLLFILFTLQQASLLFVFLYYSKEILLKMCPPTSVDDDYQNFDLVTLHFTVNTISCLFFLKIGRKPFLIFSSVGMAVTSLLLTILSMFDVFEDFRYNKIILFVLLIMFGSSGVMIIPWSLTVELLPHGIRSTGCAVLIFYGSLLLFLIEMTFHSVLHTFSISILFAFVTAVSALTSLTVYAFIPETFGKSFGEIELNFVK